MSLEFQVLGEPGRDNALLVTIDSGQSVHRLLFDCGEACLSGLRVSQIQEIEAVFFSHFHVDHIAGFDTFLRMNWSRPTGPVQIFGPPGTIEVLHHRLQGFTWNLVFGSEGEWFLHELHSEPPHTVKALSADGFRDFQEVPSDDAQLTGYTARSFEVESIRLNHGIPSMGYIVREASKENIDAERMAEMNFKPGPWLQQVKNADSDPQATLNINDTIYRVGELRAELITETAGDSIAYLTDFLLEDRAAEEELATFLAGCQTVVCENNYHDDDEELARKHCHMTTSKVAAIAMEIQAERLVLFHLSDRYTPAQWNEQLQLARRIFPRTEFPGGWNIEADD